MIEWFDAILPSADAIYGYFFKVCSIFYFFCPDLESIDSIKG